MAVLATVYARCHPKRRAVRDGLCRECAQVASAPADDPLPAMVAGCEQAGGPEMPVYCGKCGAEFVDEGSYLRCWACGGTWHVTSHKIIRRPRNTKAQTELARALGGREDRKR